VTGDCVLVEFSSAVNAMQSAVDLQQEGAPEILAACYVRLGQTQQAHDTLAAFLKRTRVGSQATFM
jgi:hypothetical protein